MSLDAVAREHRMAFVHLDDYEVERSAVELISYDVARRFQVLPLFRLPDRLALAVCRPQDLRAQDFVARLTGLAIEPVLVDTEPLEQALRRYYLVEGQSGRELARVASEAAERRKAARSPDQGPARQLAGDTASDSAPVARLVERLLTQALHLRASDLHLECARGKARLRYRVDGMLHDFPAPPVEIYPAVVSRIKILADLDIAEKRRPQDGRISIVVEEEPLDLRVSVVPQLDAEGVVIRILRTDVRVRTLEELGFGRETLHRYRKLILRSHGIVLVTGPTGSGKTTTLYATLSHINSPRRKIVTLEDPVEYRLDGICQIPVRADLNFSFPEGLRAVLRHDPDVLMIGEIRDHESAEIAVRASLTGHLLFASLHTNDAPQTVTRLLDIGLEPYQVTTSLLGVLAQRLVRRLCPHCKRAVEITPQQLQALGIKTPGRPTLCFEAVGCKECLGLGYRGRLPIYELLEFSEALRRIPAAELRSETLFEMARQEGFVPMKHCAAAAWLEGQTSLEEIEPLLGVG
ncbi:MAG: type II/IV secretion system protein [Armatimonadetes bacterium]|nr:type II/IV secretion system protein [Armatimonadota bacterium]